MAKIKSDNRTVARKKRKNWFIHLIIFVLAQIAFLIVDNYVTWLNFNLNPLGEWAKANFFDHFSGWVNIYKIETFNWMTAIWGILLIIHGLISITSSRLAK